jgi:hypothetical protein
VYNSLARDPKEIEINSAGGVGSGLRAASIC